MKVPLARPDITDADVEAVAAALRSGRLGLGPRAEAFERAVARRVGRRHGVAVNSGTSGLHLLVRALGLRPGDEVVTPSFSFVASANCLLYEGLRPVFADIEPHALGLDPAAVAARLTPRTRALLVVDVFGHPARLDELRALADRHGLAVIEDACEALGSCWLGIPCGGGRWADGAVFAFYANKQITTGEGGVVVTDADGVADACRSWRNQGRAGGGRDPAHVDLGYNYRLDEMSAALGVSQLGRLDDLLRARARVFAAYGQRLARLDGVAAPAADPRADVAWFVYVVRLDPRLDRDAVARRLAAEGVETRPYFVPIHRQPLYVARGLAPRDLEVTERVAAQVLALPFHPALDDAALDHVCDALARAIAREDGRARG